MTGLPTSLQSEPIGHHYSAQPVFHPRFRARDIAESCFIVCGVPFTGRNKAQLQIVMRMKGKPKGEDVLRYRRIVGLCSHIMHKHTLMSWPEIANYFMGNDNSHDPFWKHANKADPALVSRVIHRLEPINL
jgi:hypothetical protein